MKITIQDIRKYQDKREEIETIGEFKKLGMELKEEFNLTDRQAIFILNNDSDEILNILTEQELKEVEE